MLHTIERDSPVSRAISALLAVPRPRSASMTRPRLSSRSDRSDPESADSTGPGTLTDPGGFVKASEELRRKPAGYVRTVYKDASSRAVQLIRSQSRAQGSERDRTSHRPRCSRWRVQAREMR